MAHDPGWVDHDPYPIRTTGDADDELRVVDIVQRLEVLASDREQPRTFSTGQIVAFIVIAVAVVVSAVLSPMLTLVAVNAIFVCFFCAANVMKLVLADRALRYDEEIVVTPLELRYLRDQDLPVYTILLPVYREAAILRQLVRGIEALDYPTSKLDVKLLLEEDDTETRAAAAAMDLPPWFDVVVVPDGHPKGKPRACNAGLARAKGKYLVIYDAEDRPEPDQLKRAVCAFRRVKPIVVCLQAKLNYFNRTHNVLTRWFTAEYSVWFDQLLPGLQSSDAAIPLGGTSNHFVTAGLLDLGGWDAFNVTEDADLGLRVFAAGYKTGVLDTTTYEEATSRLHNWIRQRSRWIKGYMQTWLFHMQHPVKLARRMGAQPYLMFQLFFGSCTIGLLLNPIYWALTILWFATRMSWIELAFPWPLLYLGTVGLFVGNVACVLLLVAGAYGRRNYDDVKWALLAPVYWLLMSVAAYKALWQLFRKPSYWEKTEHGFCLYDDGSTAADVGTAALTSGPTTS